MLVALPEFSKEHMLATLVVFRILYFLIPFGISIWIMGTRELWLSVLKPWYERRRNEEACRRMNEEPCTAEVPVRQQVKRAKR
jgi:hypothetical protein